MADYWDTKPKSSYPHARRRQTVTSSPTSDSIGTLSILSQYSASCYRTPSVD
jgi:hypothetical protein